MAAIVAASRCPRYESLRDFERCCKVVYSKDPACQAGRPRVMAASSNTWDNEEQMIAFLRKTYEIPAYSKISLVAEFQLNHYRNLRQTLNPNVAFDCAYKAILHSVDKLARSPIDTGFYIANAHAWLKSPELEERVSVGEWTELKVSGQVYAWA